MMVAMMKDVQINGLWTIFVLCIWKKFGTQVMKQQQQQQQLTTNDDETNYKK